MSIIQNNLFNWSEGSDKLFSKKFGEMILMEYLWEYSERERLNEFLIDPQFNFDEVSNKFIMKLRKVRPNSNDFSADEPLVLPDTLQFGILDLAQSLVQKSTRLTTCGLCYYLAIDSLNTAQTSFIQFKSIELLLYLSNVNKTFSPIIEQDLDQYLQKLEYWN